MWTHLNCKMTRRILWSEKMCALPWWVAAPNRLSARLWYDSWEEEVVSAADCRIRQCMCNQQSVIGTLFMRAKDGSWALQVLMEEHMKPVHTSHWDCYPRPVALKKKLYLFTYERHKQYCQRKIYSVTVRRDFFLLVLFRAQVPGHFGQLQKSVTIVDL